MRDEKDQRFIDQLIEDYDVMRRALERIADGHPDGGPWSSGGAEEIARDTLDAVDAAIAQRTTERTNDGHD